MEPRSWTQPLAPTLPSPDAFLHLRLRVADAWLGEAGEWTAVAEMPSAGLWSVLGYLRWHGPSIAARDPQGADVRDVDAYLASRPLVAAIDAELAGRGEIRPGDALACLRAIGVAPWELPITRRRVARRR
jgi:hypothetical protein